MGCNYSDFQKPLWEEINFKKFKEKNLNDYFSFLRKSFISDLIDLE